MEFNFEGLEMQKWNIPVDRSQREDEKISVTCLVIMFTRGVMVFKMSKMALFSTFLLMTANNQPQLGQNIWFWATLSEVANPWKYRIFFCWHSSFLYISTLDISRMVTPKLINHTIFWKKSIKSFRYTWPKLWLIFCCHQQKIQKISHFLTL